MSTSPQSVVPSTLDIRSPEYWAALRKPDKPKTDYPPIVTEPAIEIDTCPFSSIRWYLDNAGKHGWRVRATRARHLEPPSSGGERAGSWIDYCTIAVRLNHRERSLAAWGCWWLDVERKKWDYKAGQWAFVTEWGGESPKRVTILKAFDGTPNLGASELKAVVAGRPYSPPKRKPKEVNPDEAPKPRKRRIDVA